MSFLLREEVEYYSLEEFKEFNFKELSSSVTEN